MDPADRVGEAEKQTRLARESLEATGDPEGVAGGELQEAHAHLRDALKALGVDDV